MKSHHGIIAHDEEAIVMFNHEELFTAALGLKDPLYVKDIDFKPNLGELHIQIDFRKGATFPCPVCQQDGQKVYDTRERTWRHLNFFQYKTYIHCRVPRIKCDQDGVKQIDLPWAKPGSGFTMLFEALVLKLSSHMSVSAIAGLLQEHDTRLWRIIKRYVDEARSRVDYSSITAVGVDETASKRGHRYVTLFMDMIKRRVVHVVPGKDAQTLASFKSFLNDEAIPATQIDHICADMSTGFRKGIAEEFPWATITYDRFHVIKIINDAVDQVRRDEQKDTTDLKKSRYLWLKNPNNLNKRQSERLVKLNDMNLKTGRAYRMKLALQQIYAENEDPIAAGFALQEWTNWALRSRLEPMVKVARTIINHWPGITRYFQTELTNGLLEGMNSIIQGARSRARGFRNVDNFITMIYLLGGKLPLENLQEA